MQWFSSSRGEHLLLFYKNLFQKMKWKKKKTHKTYFRKFTNKIETELLKELLEKSISQSHFKSIIINIYQEGLKIKRLTDSALCM